MNMLVIYDISEPKRLKKVAEIIKDYGKRVQKSIFEVDVDTKIFNEMRLRIENTIEVSEDGVKYFPLCKKCMNSVEIIGLGIFIDPDSEYYVL